jgi:hypothetical protein
MHLKTKVKNIQGAASQNIKKHIQKRMPEILHYPSIHYGHFLFFKIENDATESLFYIAHNSLISFRGIKQT